MNRIFIVLLSSILVFSSQTAIAAQGKVTGGVNFDIPSWFKTSFLEIADDTKAAAENNKHVMLFMHLNGCPYCNKMITENFADDKINQFLIENFDSIEINIQGDREIAFNEKVSVTEKKLAQLLKVQYTPTIIFLNKNNKPVLRLNGYRSPESFQQALAFVQSKSYLKTSFSDYKNAHIKKAHYKLTESPLYSKVTDFSQLNTPVALMFEDSNCDECTKYHKEIESLPQIKGLLKRYSYVRLDAHSNESIIDFNGNKTTPKQWAKSLKMTYRPGIVFFDKKVEISRLESMLFPFHFESLLLWGLNENYKTYPSYLELNAERTQELLDQGKNVNIGKVD